MYASCFKMWLLLISPLGLIGRSHCAFQATEETLERAFKDYDFLLKSRKVSTELSYGDEEYFSWLETGQKISGKHSQEDENIDKSLKEKKLKPKNAQPQEINEELEKRVWRKFSNLFMDLRLPLKQNAYRDFHFLLREIWNGLRRLSPQHGGQTEGQYSKEATDLELSNIFRNWKKISALLQQKDKRFQDEDLDAERKHDIKLYGVCLHLSDLLVTHFSISARYGLINTDSLRLSINHKDHWLIISHYLGGTSLGSFSITQVCLNVMFQDTLEGSLFTEEIQDFLKLLDKETWMKLSRTHLGVQIYGKVWNENLEPVFVEQFKYLGAQFIHITSPESQLLADGSIETNLKNMAGRLMNQICKIKLTTFDLSSQIIFAKILLSMLHHMQRYSPLKTHWNLEKSPVYIEFKSIEDSMMLYSDALKSVWSRFGELSKLLALDKIHKLPNPCYKMNDIILTDINKRHAGSVFDFNLEENSKNTLTSSIIKQTKYIVNKLGEVKKQESGKLSKEYQCVVKILNYPAERNE
ncbi:hypothetical protein PGT21_004631 [Puccinia graminis f. sp. tritici]|uniref:Uncharacterized protein n=1 Tax=Puccinia graminis f. sp. tritici TaxID=56615 RepID=A0A5B0S8N4_PUCGR|nr:hypothetical protein PGT21_004631 [Puccinia graminis f. sp. tritici]KAA1134270.1 hypothetical protein PGTUg99_034350 [Puccinia graminis f. sp. tritici]